MGDREIDLVPAERGLGPVGLVLDQFDQRSLGIGGTVRVRPQTRQQGTRRGRERGDPYPPSLVAGTCGSLTVAF
ncbi:hypothetical protein AVL59_16135 [Streptomyces griseochromogenes]|uniref:Uncharacterized protein n=1 Tax=Streptomyces griseochromogenes TaxID=68214 RepID=A0A1B1AWM2_9ACTN|nr:hypothetical protein AVL59_16135 [Streptomyces griseochromogenes]